MKLENQVTNLELSKKLERLGVKQESVWYWVRFDHGNKKVKDWALLERKNCFNEEDTLHIDYVSAFTVAELGNLMKFELGDGLFLWNYHLPKRDCFDLVLRDAPQGKILWEERAKTEADARSLMLIYLIENKLFAIT